MILDNVCSKGLSDDLTQWFCSTSSSLSLHSSKEGLSSPLYENWSIIWLDDYETLQKKSSVHIYDFDTFHEVLESKQPNYINLVEYEDDISYQIFYWPLFSTDKSLEGLDESEISFPLDTSALEDRPVIGILQCRIRRDSTDRSTFLEQSLCQPRFLSYFNSLIGQIYPYIADGEISSEDQKEDPIDDTGFSLLGDSQVFPSSSFYSDLSLLLDQISSQGECVNFPDILHCISETIWGHSTHTQPHAVGVFVLDNDSSEYFGSIRSFSPRSILINDDEENQSISIQLNPNRYSWYLQSLSLLLSRVTDCRFTSLEFLSGISTFQPYEKMSVGSSFLTPLITPNFAEGDESEATSRVYRLILPIDSDTGEETRNYLVAEYILTPPKPSEMLFLKLMGSIIQTFLNTRSARFG